jgi:adenylate cyclase
VGEPRDVAPQPSAPQASAEHAPPVPEESSHSLWETIKHHKVVEWTLAYTAFGYALLHGVEMVSDAFGWPPAAARATIFVLALGIPVVATLAWYHGARARSRISGFELAILTVLLVIAGSVLWLVSRGGHQQPHLQARTVIPSATSAALVQPAFSPPPHSIAVLPFTNLSGDPKEEYFSDGVSEELINALSQIDALQVAARTSSFSFKGKNVDIRTIARTLGVASILEGSIRRSGNEVRITAQLINAVNGFHIWSKEYDHDLSNILALQSDIATSVAAQLQAKLVGDESAKIEAGGTHHPQAYDAYLRGLQRFESSDLTDEAAGRAALAWYDRAIALDSNYAAAYAQRARVLSAVARFSPAVSRKQRQELFRQARDAAERAVALAPEFADGHMALGWHVLLFGYFDFQGATREIDRAMSLAPGSAYVLRTYASFQSLLGHQDIALATIRHAVSLDPQNYLYNTDLLGALDSQHRFSEELTEAQRVRTLKPDAHDTTMWEVYAYLGLRRPEEAFKLCSSPATPLDTDDRHYCLALTYDALGKRAEGEQELDALRALDGDFAAVYYADIYAQLAEPAAALRWLATAERERNPYVLLIKADVRLDPIRSEPAFKALERRLNFPASNGSVGHQ